MASKNITMNHIIEFQKYQATGNDFVIIDNRKNEYNTLTHSQISNLCNRKFGIGADGLIMLENSQKHDFAMRYFNSDGHEATMCGNGGRCITLFAKHIGIIQNNATFEAIDGIHTATVLSDDFLKISMSDCLQPKEIGKNCFFIDTGSPHVVIFTENIEKIDIKKDGKKIREKENANVNFCEIENKKIKIRTYERGVEDETLSCGTGSTAAAITAAVKGYLPENQKIEIITKGGNLFVEFEIREKIEKIFLIGQAKKIFYGKIEIKDFFVKKNYIFAG